VQVPKNLSLRELAAAAAAGERAEGSGGEAEEESPPTQEDPKLAMMRSLARRRTVPAAPPPSAEPSPGVQEVRETERKRVSVSERVSVCVRAPAQHYTGVYTCKGNVRACTTHTHTYTHTRSHGCSLSSLLLPCHPRPTNSPHDNCAHVHAALPSPPHNAHSQDGKNRVTLVRPHLRALPLLPPKQSWWFVVWKGHGGKW
jgi:hypothetical protein